MKTKDFLCLCATTRFGPNRVMVDMERNGELDFWGFLRNLEIFMRIFGNLWRIFREFLMNFADFLRNFEEIVS